MQISNDGTPAALHPSTPAGMADRACRSKAGCGFQGGRFPADGTPGARSRPATAPSKAGILLLVALLMASMHLLTPPRVVADARQGAEYQVKAEYLYHFARFVEWPAEAAGSPLVICILGKSPLSFTNSLSNISGKMIRSRRVVITYINRIEELQGCEILYVSNSEKGKLDQIVAAVGSRPILTISDIRRFAAAGGMIGFVPVGDKVRFEINQRASQRSNLRISAQLLKLATTVAD